MLGIRPEAITDPDGADRKSNHIQLLKNIVGVTEPAGPDTYVSSILGGVDCVARMRADVNAEPGQTTDFAINMEKAIPLDLETENRIV